MVAALIRGVVMLCAMLCSAVVMGAEKIHKQEFHAFGTLINVVIFDVDEATAQKAFSIVVEDFQWMNETWHPWKAGSLARVNSLLPVGGSFSIAPSLIPIINKSRELYVLTDGLFNPAIGGLVKLWGFNQDDLPIGPPPDDKLIRAEIAKAPKITDVTVRGFSLESSNKSVLLDFGAIAKGYAVDRVLEHLREIGIRNVLLGAAGDIHVLGSKGDQAWHVGIRNPRGNGVIASVKLKDGETISTSGDYERFYLHANQRYHHIFDPRTGFPAKGFIAATVMHTESAFADAATTALFIAGPSQWKKIAKQLKLKYVMLTTSDGEIILTPEFKQRLQFEVSPVPRVIESRIE